MLDEGSAEAAAATDLVGQRRPLIGSLTKIDSARQVWPTRLPCSRTRWRTWWSACAATWDEIEYNPKRLEDIEERLNLIHGLTRKYGGDIPAVIQFGVEARKQLENISGAGERIDTLTAQEADLLKTVAAQGQALTEKRKAAAAQLSKKIEVELDDLKMAAARFGVEFRTRGPRRRADAGWHARGIRPGWARPGGVPGGPESGRRSQAAGQDRIRG